MQDFYLKVADLMSPWFPQPGEGYSWPLFAILCVFFLVGVFVVREFVSWFFKINDIKNGLKRIERLLETKKEKEQEGVKVVR